MNKKLLLNIPPLIRHQLFFERLLVELNLRNISVINFCSSPRIATYWADLLNTKVYSTSDFKADELEKLDLNEVLEKANDILGMNLSIRKILNCQYTQSAFPIREPAYYENYLSKQINVIAHLINQEKISLIYNHSLGIDLDNVAFNISSVLSPNGIVMWDYSPIVDFESTFCRGYYQNYIQNMKATEDLKSRFSNFVNRTQIVNPNDDYFDKLAKSPWYFWKLTINNWRAAFYHEECSVFLAIYRNLIRRYNARVYNRAFGDSKTKPRNNRKSKTALFVCTSFREGFFHANYSNLIEFLDTLDKFFSEMDGYDWWIKLHPISRGESEAKEFSDLAKKRFGNRVSFTSVPLSDDKLMDFDLVAGLGSSVLTRAKCLGIESVSLLSGVPNMFGVKNFGPSIEKASSKKIYFFPGKQRWYTERAINLQVHGICDVLEQEISKL